MKQYKLCDGRNLIYFSQVMYNGKYFDYIFLYICESGQEEMFVYDHQLSKV